MQRGKTKALDEPLPASPLATTNSITHYCQAPHCHSSLLSALAVSVGKVLGQSCIADSGSNRRDSGCENSAFKSMHCSRRQPSLLRGGCQREPRDSRSRFHRTNLNLLVVLATKAKGRFKRASCALREVARPPKLTLSLHTFISLRLSARRGADDVPPHESNAARANFVICYVDVLR